MRIGYYKLFREKEISDDWIWIIDHTIQIGNEKCLVILGIRQSALPAAELYLNHEDIEPIALLPVSKSNGQIVYEQLEEAVRQCHHQGAKGVSLFCLGALEDEHLRCVEKLSREFGT